MIGTYVRAGLMSVLMLLVAAVAVASENFSPADAEGRYNYLVTFAEPGLLEQHRQQRGAGQRFDIQSPANLSARDALMALQASHLADMANVLRRPLTPSHYYLVTHSGVTARLSETEARQMAAMPHIVSVERERVYELSTYRGPEFIGAGSLWNGSSAPGGNGLQGEGMIAAILDTGIPAGAHASFNNDPACGHGSTFPNKVLSSLDCGSTDGTGLCNGASPGDTNGHGSHTASTVAGNRVTSGASPNPTIPGAFTEMSGVAPCAHIRSYKTCPGNNCPGADLVAGLNSVLLHGDPHSVNFSISGGTNPWNDNDRIKLDIVDAGIYVAASAGNTSAGVPNPVGQVNHRGPWVMSVAASTRDTNNAGGAAQGDVLAGFSFRGPTPAPLRDLQKPNITGPGVSIYAAVPGGYQFISGTSMSGPHLAGAGLLVAQAHPDWAPSEIKSAIEMTAFKGGFKENGSTPWNWDDVGSGRVDLTKAALAGLVMDETFQNFLDANPAASGDVRTLNLASVRNLDCTPNCTFIRTVRNTLGTSSSWTATGSAIDSNFNVDVSPSSFDFIGDTSETQVLTITVSPMGDLTSGVAFGEVLFSENSSQSPDLHLTVAISGVGGPEIAVTPSSLSFSLDAGQSDSATLAISNTGTDTLNWTIDEANPDSAAFGIAGAVTFDEMLTIPDFTVNPTTSANFDVPAGIANTGNVVGFTFQGTVTAIGGPDWASDMRMTVSAPDGPQFDAGGFDGVVNPWSFQGAGSTNPGTYSSTHMGAFGAGTGDAGDWNFLFEHDWSGGTDMSWENVTVTLHKEALVCEDVTDINWLSVDIAAGTTPVGNSSDVQVMVDATGLAPGVYSAQLCINSNAANASIVSVPVELEVFAVGGPDDAIVEGTIQSLGYCALNPTALSGIEVVITSQGGSFSAFTNASGFYQRVIDAAEGPVDISVAAAGHVAASVTGVPLVAQQTQIEDFDLLLAAACATSDPNLIAVTVAENGSGSELLTIGNDNGGADLNWAISTEELAIGNSRRHFPASPFFGPLGDSTGASALADPAAGQFAAAGGFGLQGGPTVPAYSTTGFTADGYVTMDALVPGALTILNAAQPTNFFAGAFIDNDFSQQFVLATGGGASPADTFGSIDTTSGAFTALGTVTGAVTGTWTSMKWDHSTETLYAMNVPGAGNNNLYTIDPATLQATLVGTVSGPGVDPGALVISIAITTDGLMYGIDLVADVLLAVDKQTANASVIGPLGFNANFAQDMDFDHSDGTLYWAGYFGGGNSQMLTIDIATGAATSIGNVANGNELLSFSIAINGAPAVCSNPGIVPWLSLIPDAGTAIAGASSSVQVDMDASGLAPGLYEANLCIDSSDSNNELMIVPVSMTVISGTDEVFEDRFEQP